MRARAYAYRDRRVRRRAFRQLWIVRISAACRMNGLRYSQFIAGLTNAGVELDRKSLSQIAIHDMDAFKEILALAVKHLPAGLRNG